MSTDHRGCDAVREAVSARIDGEDGPLTPEVVNRHLEQCADCARYADRLVAMNRSLRVTPADPVPDLTAPILAALAQSPATASPRFRQLRWLVALAGVVQLVLAIPVLLGLMGPDLHLGRDLGSLQLALGVGLLVAAQQPRRAPGVLPVAAVVAAAAVVTGVLDLVTGQARLLAELPHLAEIVGVAALWGLSRRLPEDHTPPPLKTLAADA